MAIIISYVREVVLITFSAIQMFWLCRKSRELLFHDKTDETYCYDLVSIIVATRNNGATIEESIQSLLVQTYCKLEIIVIDDSSDDVTPMKLARLAKMDNRISVITNRMHRGTGYSRNLGLRAARGKYVTFQDGDDFSGPQRIALQLQAMKALPGKILSICSYVRIDENGHSLWVNDKRTKACIVSMMFLREPVLRDVGYFTDASLGEDTDYFERIKIKFGERSILRIWKVMYFALFRPGSSFFSSVVVKYGKFRRMNYGRTSAGAEAYHKLNGRHEKMRRNEISIYEPFIEH